MSERGEAHKDGARLQPNSGRGIHRKGDAIIGNVLIDYKEYTKSFSVTIRNWLKLRRDAFNEGRKQPCFKLVLSDGKQTVRVAVIDWDYFMELIENE